MSTNPHPPGMPHTVAIVDDHEAPMAGVAAELARFPDEFAVVARSASVEEHLSGPGADADLVLLDLYLDHDTFIGHRVPELLARGSVVVAHTSEERPFHLREVVRLGVMGVVLKRDRLATVPEVLRSAALGQFSCSGTLAHALLEDPLAMARLTDREREVLALLDDGLTRHQAARQLGIAETTVATYLNRVRDAYREMGVEAGNTQGLITLARQEGQLGGPPGSLDPDHPLNRAGRG